MNGDVWGGQPHSKLEFFGKAFRHFFASAGRFYLPSGLFTFEESLQIRRPDARRRLQEKDLVDLWSTPHADREFRLEQR